MPVDVVVEQGGWISDTRWEHAIAERFGDAVRVLAVPGDDIADTDISHAEVVISGWDGAAGVSFSEILEAMTELRWIHSISAGLDGFASPSLAQRDVTVTSSGAAYAPAMAEHAICSMIALARGFPQLVRNQLEKRWEWDWTSLEARGLGRELSGKTVGIVGLGRVGRRVATGCRALGMEVWGLRRTPSRTSDDASVRLLGPSQLGELLAHSDFVVLSASLNGTTAALIGAAELRTMRRSAVLINVGRGGLIDQRALIDALRTGEIAAAAVDVTTPEPLPPGDELWNLKNVLISPHIAGDSTEGVNRAVEIFLDNMECYLAGDLAEMPDRVNLSAHL